MATTHVLPVLERITIASPCTADWEQMTGDEKSRHCAQCNLKVHNLSAMTREEAEALVTSAGGKRMCVRLYQRADGTVLTQDCPVGLAAARAKLRRGVARVAAAVGMVSAAAAAGVDTSRQNPTGPVRLRALNPFSMLAEWLVPTPPAMPPAVGPNTGRYVMGDRCFVPSRTLPPLVTPPSPPNQPN